MRGQIWVGGSQEPKLSRVRDEREWGPGSCEAEKRDLEISQGFRSKCCAQCIVRKPSVKGTLFTDAFMGVDYFQCVHRRDDFCLKVAPSLW